MWPEQEKVIIRPPGCDEAHGVEVDVLVAARGALDFAAALRERGRVADDAGRTARGAVRTYWNASATMMLAVESVQRVVLARDLDRARGDVDVRDRGRAARRRVHAERAAVGEEIEHALPARERAREAPVLALVEEEPGLLPLGGIDAKPQARFEDSRRRLDRRSSGPRCEGPRSRCAGSSDSSTCSPSSFRAGMSFLKKITRGASSRCSVSTISGLKCSAPRFAISTTSTSS